METHVLSTPGCAMKTFALALTLLTLVPAATALARDHDLDSPHLSMNCCEDPTRWASREDTRDAIQVITTDDGDVSLLLMPREVALQFSDRTWKKINRKLRDKDDQDEDNALADAIKAAVISSVRSMLDHSVQCRIRDIEDVRYRNGRLEIVAENGKHLFRRLEVNDRDVMTAFTESDARAFVRAFKNAKARL